MNAGLIGEFKGWGKDGVFMLLVGRDVDSIDTQFPAKIPDLNDASYRRSSVGLYQEKLILKGGGPKLFA